LNSKFSSSEFETSHCGGRRCSTGFLKAMLVSEDDHEVLVRENGVSAGSTGSGAYTVVNGEEVGSGGVKHHRGHLHARGHACCHLLGRYIGPFLLFLSIGAVLGGLLARAEQKSKQDRATGDSSWEMHKWSFDSLCDERLGRLGSDGKRIVETRLCVQHEPTSGYSRALQDSLVSFLVIGDWGRDGMCCQRDVALEMDLSAAKIDADFVINTGDNFYPRGLPSATDEQVKTSWIDVYNGETLKNLIWYSVLGNHDHLGVAEANFRMDELYETWVMPDNSFSKSFANNEVFVVFLDTTPCLPNYEQLEQIKRLYQEKGVSSSSQYLHLQLEFLRKEMSASSARWKFVVGHHPVYTSSDHFAEDHVTLRTHLRPVLDELGVDAYFNGHDHGLEEHNPESSSARFVLSGAGSQVRPLTVAKDEGFVFHFAEQSGFVSTSLNSTHMLIQFIDFRGSLLFESWITKSTQNSTNK